MENFDSLVDLLASSSVTEAPNSTARAHPRYSQYKNVGRAENNQEKRRREFLERQKEARFDYANHARRLASRELSGDCKVDDFEMIDVSKSKKSGRIKKANRYADELMLSEWLVDIPVTLSEDWILVPCPVGKRCLIVASNGLTTAYSKAGYLITQFHSYLPGGNRSSQGTFTLLDCIFSEALSTFYCLDMMTWNGSTIADSDFECRLFMLSSRITENENFKEISKQFPYRFICLPSCRCEHKLMEEMMYRDFEFELDGVLFYHANVHYVPGQSPLVGWLKPWMMPEILSVSVPEKLMLGNMAEDGNTRKFIQVFNKEHKHVSKLIKVPKVADD